MLNEQIIASVGVPTKALGTNVAKDAAIFIHQTQPVLAQQQAFKKSATTPNCLAVSSTHIFAAQAEKAVVHVYSRDKANQEAIVPFTERITCITLACDDTVLVLGTGEGRLFLWEITSGRQISTSQAHLQAVTALSIDGTGNFLLSTSKDSTVHVWSVTSLLSFANPGAQLLSPIRTFTSHQAEVTAIVLGRSEGFANFAASVSADKTCLVWDYHSNAVLRTYLLPSRPTCLDIDAAERAIYVGYEDGCIQQLDFYASGSMPASSQDLSKQAPAPLQPPESSLWKALDNSVGIALSISVSFDSCTILTGHENGALMSWDVGKNGLSHSLLQAPLPGPVTNVQFLPLAGLRTDQQHNLKVLTIVKPKFGAFHSSSGGVPSNYTVNVELPADLQSGGGSDFQTALCSPSFPIFLLDNGLNELMQWSNGRRPSERNAEEGSEDFMALDVPSGPRPLSLEEQNSVLQAEIDALRRVQVASFAKIDKISLEKKALLEREAKRVGKESEIAARASLNGQVNGDRNMDDSSSSED